MMGADTHLTHLKRQFIVSVVLVLTLVVASLACAQESAGKLFQSGLYQEEVKGDLGEAIKVYERVLKDFPKDRPVAAKALLHMGLCYEKLGATEAQKAYRRLLEEFADQPEPVAQARIRLSNLGIGTDGVAPAMSTRQVWAPALDTMGAPSPDGRYISFVNWDNKGNLALHDLKTGENRDLTKEGIWDTPSQFCDVSIWSPDSSQIAYCWIHTGDGTDLRIVGLDGSEPRVLYDEPESGYAWPRAWSHDGKQIAGIFCNKDTVEAKESDHIDKICLVSVEDGSLRILKSLGNCRSRFMNFSPDDRYLVYDAETEAGSKTSDIHLLAIDGSQETPLVVHPANDSAPFWTPDGKRIVFMSDRSGSQALWMLEVDKGKPQDTPTQIKEMGSHFGPMGLTQDGSLYCWVATPAFDIYVATLDFEAGKVSTLPTKMSLRYEGSNYAPSWSPDGKYLAYASRRIPQVDPVLVIQDVETGEERDISSETVRVLVHRGTVTPRWSPDGSSILVSGHDRNGRRGLYLVDVETGSLTPIARSESEKEGVEYVPPLWPVFSNDGKRIYYMRGQSIMVHDRETHGERELCRTNTYILRLAASPDGRQLAFLEAERALRPTVVKTISTSGGEPSELYTLKKGNRFSWGVGLAWTPDGDHVVVGAPDAPDKPDELWMIPAEGGEPRKLGLGVKVDHISLHPDGRRIAFTGPEPGGDGEVWVMENFLPE